VRSFVQATLQAVVLAGARVGFDIASVDAKRWGAQEALSSGDSLGVDAALHDLYIYAGRLKQAWQALAQFGVTGTAVEVQQFDPHGATGTVDFDR
jgi:hypothetical protein